MTKKELESMISSITADIRAYQTQLGSHIVYDKNSEAYNLCEVKLRLQLSLQSAV
jgi:hypothetical protein